MRYDPDWKPLELPSTPPSGGQAIEMRTTSPAHGTSQVTIGGTAAQQTDTIDDAAVLLLPSSVFAPVRSLAARLKTAAPGSTLPRPCRLHKGRLPIASASRRTSAFRPWRG